MLFVFFLLFFNSTIIALPISDFGSELLNTFANYIPGWSSGEAASQTATDDEEVKDSLKLIDLFPYLEKQLNSPDEEERNKAFQFISEMRQKIHDSKRYTTILWKGVKKIIDMGKWQSTERRAAKSGLEGLWIIIQGILDTIRCIFVNCKKPEFFTRKEIKSSAEVVNS